ncbi:hypothetical protein NFI96_020982 [Prochilodus magdalenae]|nr:hypothetical protein NFI96_020982 [Prochilodus magdalenae]
MCCCCLAGGITTHLLPDFAALCSHSAVFSCMRVCSPTSQAFLYCEFDKRISLEADIHTERVAQTGEKSSSAENGSLPTEAQPSHSPAAEVQSLAYEEHSQREQEDELEFPHDLLPSIDLSTELNLTWGASLGKLSPCEMKNEPVSLSEQVNPLLVGLQHYMEASPPVVGLIESQDGGPLPAESPPLEQPQLHRTIQEIAPSHQPSVALLDIELQEAFQRCEEQMASFGIPSLSVPPCTADPIDVCLSVPLPDSDNERCEMGCQGKTGVQTKDEADCREDVVFSFRDYILGNKQAEETGKGEKMHDETLKSSSDSEVLTETEEMKAPGCVTPVDEEDSPKKESRDMQCTALLAMGGIQRTRSVEELQASFVGSEEEAHISSQTMIQTETNTEPMTNTDNQREGLDAHLTQLGATPAPLLEHVHETQQQGGADDEKHVPEASDDTTVIDFGYVKANPEHEREMSCSLDTCPLEQEDAFCLGGEAATHTVVRGNTHTLSRAGAEERRKEEEEEEEEEESALEEASALAIDSALPLTTPTMPEMIECEGVGEKEIGDVCQRATATVEASAKESLVGTTELREVDDSPSSEGKKSEVIAAETHSNSLLFSETSSSPAVVAEEVETASEQRGELVTSVTTGRAETALASLTSGGTEARSSPVSIEHSAETERKELAGRKAHSKECLSAWGEKPPSSDISHLPVASAEGKDFPVETNYQQVQSTLWTPGSGTQQVKTGTEKEIRTEDQHTLSACQLEMRDITGRNVTKPGDVEGTPYAKKKVDAAEELKGTTLSNRLIGFASLPPLTVHENLRHPGTKEGTAVNGNVQERGESEKENGAKDDTAVEENLEILKKNKETRAKDETVIITQNSLGHALSTKPTKENTTVLQGTGLQLGEGDRSLFSTVMCQGADAIVSDGQGENGTEVLVTTKQDQRSNPEQPPVMSEGCLQTKPEKHTDELQYQRDSSHEDGKVTEIAIDVVGTEDPTHPGKEVQYGSDHNQISTPNKAKDVEGGTRVSSEVLKKDQSCGLQQPQKQNTTETVLCESLGDHEHVCQEDDKTEGLSSEEEAKKSLERKTNVKELKTKERDLGNVCPIIKSTLENERDELAASYESENKPLACASESEVNVDKAGNLENTIADPSKAVELAINDSTKPAENSSSSHKNEVQPFNVVILGNSKCTEVCTSHTDIKMATVPGSLSKKQEAEPTVQLASGLTPKAVTPLLDPVLNEKVESDDVNKVFQDTDNPDITNKARSHLVEFPITSASLTKQTLEVEQHTQTAPLDSRGVWQDPVHEEQQNPELLSVKTCTGTEEEVKNMQATVLANECRKEEIGGCSEERGENETTENRKFTEMCESAETRSAKPDLNDREEGNEGKLTQDTEENSVFLAVKTVSGGSDLSASGAAGGLQSEQKKPAVTESSLSPESTAVSMVTNSQDSSQTLLCPSAEPSQGSTNSFIQSLRENALGMSEPESGKNHVPLDHGSFGEVDSMQVGNMIQKEETDGGEDHKQISRDEEKSVNLNTSVSQAEDISGSPGPAVGPVKDMNPETVRHGTERSCESSEWLRTMREAASISHTQHECKAEIPHGPADNRPFETLGSPQAELEFQTPTEESTLPVREQPEEPPDSSVASALEMVLP